MPQAQDDLRRRVSELSAEVRIQYENFSDDLVLLEAILWLRDVARVLSRTPPDVALLRGEGATMKRNIERKGGVWVGAGDTRRKLYDLADDLMGLYEVFYPQRPSVTFWKKYPFVLLLLVIVAWIAFSILFPAAAGWGVYVWALVAIAAAIYWVYWARRRA